MLETGSKVQEFTIATDRGHFTLSDYRGKNVVIFFFQEQTHLVAQKRLSLSQTC